MENLPAELLCEILLRIHPDDFPNFACTCKSITKLIYSDDFIMFFGMRYIKRWKIINLKDLNKDLLFMQEHKQQWIYDNNMRLTYPMNKLLVLVKNGQYLFVKIYVESWEDSKMYRFVKKAVYKKAVDELNVLRHHFINLALGGDSQFWGRFSTGHKRKTREESNTLYNSILSIYCAYQDQGEEDTSLMTQYHAPGTYK